MTATSRTLRPMAALWLLAAAPVVALTACSSAPAHAAEPVTRAVSGSMNLAGTAFDGQGNVDLTYTPGDTCTAASGFDDIAPGTEVDILDPAGKVVGVGQLDDGAIGPDKYTCEFAFKVLAVPTSETLYGIKIGNQARGVVHFSKAQLFAGPELTLSGDL